LPGHFLDSSAVAKLYHVELGSPVLRALATGADGLLYISRLAVVEFHLLLRGKYAQESWRPPISRCFARASAETFVVNCYELSP
jgi:hypothetical protein